MNPQLLALLLAIGHTPVLGPSPIEATLKVRDVSFCWARRYSNIPERLPAAAITMRVELTVEYRNPGPRPVIVPKGHESLAYIGEASTHLTKARQAVSIFNSKILSKVSDVSEENFDAVFAIVPPGGQLPLALTDSVAVTVFNPSQSGGKDWRGSRMFLSLEETQQPVSSRVSDVLEKRGQFWTGRLRTSIVEVIVPQSPAVRGDCR